MRASTTLRRTAAAVVAVAAAAAGAAPAHAQAPTPCTTIIKSDPSGDQTTYVVGQDAGQASEPDGDITGIFINRTPEKTTLHLVVANVAKKVPDAADSLVYRIFYTANGTSRYIESGVRVTGSEPYYDFGTFEGRLVSEGDTTGAWTEGPNGVISIDVPAEAGGAMGVKFSEMYGFASYGRGAIVTPTDYIPDGGNTGSRMAWNGLPCPAGGAPAAPAPATPAAVNPNAGGEARPAAAQGPLVVSVRPASLKAKKVKKARKLKLALDAREQLKNVSVTLKKGKKSMGAARIASLTNISKFSLKLKKKGLKKGAYSLLVKGTRADGSSGAVTLKLRVK